MTATVIETAVALADLLARENAALAALDLPNAAALVDDKQRALAAFTVATATRDAATGPMAGTALSRELITRLQHAAQENRRLLEHAIAVQGRVLGLLAGAAPRALARTPQYNAAGATAGARRVAPVALSARA